MNAKDLITLWADANSPLHEYACRQWSSLLNDFYKPRWQQFFTIAENALQKNTELNFTAFNKTIAAWEWKWVNKRKSFPVTTTGNSIVVAKELYTKYREIIESVYQ